MKWLWICLSIAASAEPVLLATMGASKAALSFDGKTTTVAVGETSHGIKLISVAPDSAVLDAGGQRKTVKLGQGFFAGSGSGDGASGSSVNKVTLYNQNGHFWIDVGNSRASFHGLIDTGASALALSYTQAVSMGLKIDHDTPTSHASTAQGVVGTWYVKVPELHLGGITLYDVDAMVLQTNALAQPLVGMSVLNRFAMTRDGDSMTLSKRF